MLATGLRLTQVLLAVACLGVVASGVQPLVAAPALPEAHVPARPPVAALEQDFPRYAVIGERNLFQTLDAAPEPVVEEAKLEETKLRLRLLGTIVSNIPERSIASIEDLNQGKRLALAIDDEVAGATLVRVESHRVVLDNHGKLEQITVEDMPTPAVASRKAPRARVRPAERNRLRGRARRQSSPSPSVQETRSAQGGLEDPAQSATGQPGERNRLRERAQRQPSASPSMQEPPSAQGVLEDLVQSVTGQLGPGERVKSVNGYSLDDPTSLPEMLAVITGEGAKTVVVVDPYGNERQLDMR